MNLSVGAIQSRYHQCARRAAGRLPEYRRLHLLIGDSNMSPYANALKIGTTACVLSLLEEVVCREILFWLMQCKSTRDISRDTSERWMVRLENGKTMSALDVQWEFHHLAQKHLGHSSAELTGYWKLGYVPRSNSRTTGRR